jgi:hypothetical protein
MMINFDLGLFRYGLNLRMKTVCCDLRESVGTLIVLGMV